MSGQPAYRSFLLKVALIIVMGAAIMAVVTGGIVLANTAAPPRYPDLRGRRLRHRRQLRHHGLPDAHRQPAGRERPELHQEPARRKARRHSSGLRRRRHRRRSDARATSTPSRPSTPPRVPSSRSRRATPPSSATCSRSSRSASRRPSPSSRPTAASTRNTPAGSARRSCRRSSPTPSASNQPYREPLDIPLRAATPPPGGVAACGRSPELRGEVPGANPRRPRPFCLTHVTTVVR